MEGFATNAINVGYLGTAPALFKRIRANITIVASVNAEGSAIIARLDSGINNVSQLSGKKVAIPDTATVQDVLLRLALSQYGLSYGNLSSGYPVAPVAPSTMPNLLNNGEFDAYIAWEPYCALSIINSYDSVVVNSSQIWSEHRAVFLRFAKTS